MCTRSHFVEVVQLYTDVTGMDSEAMAPFANLAHAESLSSSPSGRSLVPNNRNPRIWFILVGHVKSM